MPWQINIIPDLPIVETIFSDFLTEEELNLAMTQTLAIAKNHTIKLFLGDCTKMNGVESIAVLFLLSGALKLRSVIVPSMKAIILRNLSFATEQVHSWQTTCLDRGIVVRLFSDRQFAIDWLLF